MNSYKECEQYLSKGRDKSSRPIANNTRVERRYDDTIAIRFHATDIVTYHADGRIVLSTGGWHTKTTAERIYQFSPSKGPYSVDGIWYVDAKPSKNDPRPFAIGTPLFRRIPKPFEVTNPGPEPVKPEGNQWEAKTDEEREAWRIWSRWYSQMNGNGYGLSRGLGFNKMRECLREYGRSEAWQVAYLEEFRDIRDKRKLLREWESRNRVRFFDGIEIDAEGYARKPKRSTGRSVNKIKREKAKISRFVKYCMDEIEAGHVELPGPGDCFYCCMTTDTSGDDRRTLGDATGSHEHLSEHIREKYIVPSMLVNAMRERGYSDLGIPILLGGNLETGKMGYRTFSRDSVERALRAYLQSRLVPEASNSTPTGAALRQTAMATR